jgi:hypothetical protein
MSTDAYGVSAGQQVGSGTLSESTHALLWSGNAQSVVDLHPPGYFATMAADISGDQQVGTAMLSVNGPSRALLWSGSAESVVSLHPQGYTSSAANGVAAGQQVGSGTLSESTHALLWSGSAQSVVDLHQFLPAGYISSMASAIDEAGNIAGSACPDTSAACHAVLWKPSAGGED